MNIALFQHKYDEMVQRVLVDEYMKPTDEKENVFAERQITISKINGMVDKIGLMEGATPIIAKDDNDVIGYSLPDPVRKDVPSFYYVDKIPAEKEKELFTQYGKEATVDKIAYLVSLERKIYSDDEVLDTMEKAMDMPQYRLLDEKEFCIVHGENWFSENDLLSMIKEGKTDFTVVSEVESFYVDWDIIEETLKNADLTADDIFGEVPDEYLSGVKESLESEVTPNFNSKDGYYETSAYTKGEISDILDDISASNLHLSFDLETQDRKDFGSYNRLFAVVVDNDGLQSLYRLPVLVNDETGELETLSDICGKVQLYCSQINDDECWIKVPNSGGLFYRAITDLSLEDDRKELQVEKMDFTAYEYSPVKQKEQAKEKDMQTFNKQSVQSEKSVNTVNKDIVKS